MKFTLPSFFVFFCHSASALELSLGEGNFSAQTDINQLLSSNVRLNTTTWSLTEKHKNIWDSRLYYQFQFDYFNSDTVDKITNFASQPASTPIPIIGSSIDDNVDRFTQIPVPADYQVRGIDFNIGLGYDLIKKSKITFGIAFNTGLSTPFMKIRNMDTTANLVIDLLDTFDTKVKTYKLGSCIYGGYQINKQLSLIGTTSFNYQTGNMENDVLGSNIDINGRYQTLDLSMRYRPNFLKGFYLTGGYSYKTWDYGSTTVNTPIGSSKIARGMDIEFKISNIYLGAGYYF